MMLRSEPGTDDRTLGDAYDGWIARFADRAVRRPVGDGWIMGPPHRKFQYCFTDATRLHAMDTHSRRTMGPFIDSVGG